jgi:signal peptidase II
MYLRLLVLLVLCLSLVGCDHATKHLALVQFRETPVSLWSGSLTLTYTENRDMAFGILGALLSADARLMTLSFAKTMAVVGGLAFLWVRRREGTWLELGAVSLVVAGAAGNLIDRVMRGYVIDFLRVPYWPVFNVADIAICVGGALWVLRGVLSPSPSGSRAAFAKGAGQR